MSETQRTEPGISTERPVYTLASPEFFHLLQRIEQSETVLRGEIKQSETVLRGEIAGLRGEIKQTETSLREEIKQVETALRGEIAGLRSWVIATLYNVPMKLDKISEILSEPDIIKDRKLSGKKVRENGEKKTIYS